MAKIARPLNSEKARGEIGGIIFSESNNVNYVRRNTVKPYVQTEKRKEVANRLALASAGWQRMTDEERKRWEDFADTHEAEDAFGQKFKKPAFAWYVSSRENLYSVRHPKVPSIAEAEFPPTPTGLTMTTPSIFQQYLVIYALQGEEVPKDYLRLYISKEKSPSRIFNFSECTLWKADTANIANNRYNITTTQYNAFKGVYTIFAQFVNRDSGLAGKFLKTRIVFE